jgi:cell division protein FtsW (lipid II flippase)
MNVAHAVKSFKWLISFIIVLSGFVGFVQLSLAMLADAYRRGTANAESAKKVLEFFALILTYFGINVSFNRLWPWISIMVMLMTIAPVLLVLLPMLLFNVRRARSLV